MYLLFIYFLGSSKINTSVHYYMFASSFTHEFVSPHHRIVVIILKIILCIKYTLHYCTTVMIVQPNKQALLGHNLFRFIHLISQLDALNKHKSILSTIHRYK